MRICFFSCILAIAMLFMIVVYAYGSSDLREKPNAGSSLQVKLKEKLEAILSSNGFDEKVCFGFYDYAGSSCPLVEVNSQELKVYGNTRVVYNTQTPFADKNSERLIICCMEYRYSVYGNKIRKICEEFLKSGFFTDKFDEERELAGLDETPYRGIFFSYNDTVFTRKFMLPMAPERQKKLEQDFPSLLQRGLKIDGAGLSPKLSKLQYLFDDIIIDKVKDMQYPRGSVYLFDQSKGPIPVDFRKYSEK